MNRTFDPVSLRLFIAVCEEGNIARAAAREALVASAVSKRMAQLEAELGMPLLLRGRRGIEPTPAGQTLLRQAREMLNLMARVHAELSAFTQGVVGNVRIVASVSALALGLPRDVAGFLEAHPRLHVSLTERVGKDVVREVREGTADLGVVWDAVGTGDLPVLPYRGDRLGLLMPLDHPLAARRSVSFAQALPYPAVSVTPGGLLDDLVRRQAGLLGAAWTPRMEVASFEAAEHIVAAGLGVAIVPIGATGDAAGTLVCKPLKDAWARRQLVILSRSEPWLSAPARAVRQHLAEVAQGLSRVPPSPSPRGPSGR